MLDSLVLNHSYFECNVLDTSGKIKNIFPLAPCFPTAVSLLKLRLSARWATELHWQPPEEYICEIVEMLCVWNVSYCILLEIKLLLLLLLCSALNGQGLDECAKPYTHNHYITCHAINHWCEPALTTMISVGRSIESSYDCRSELAYANLQ